MKIAFVSGNREKLPDAAIPLGMLYVMASTPESHEKVLVDLCFEPRPEDALRTCLESLQPDLVALGLRNIQNNDYSGIADNVDYYKRLIEVIREVTTAPVVLGGSGFTDTRRLTMVCSHLARRQMSLRELTNAAIVLTAALFVWSCVQAPVQNIEDEAIVSRSVPTLDEVETAILKAGRIRGWKMKPVEPGHIVATLDIRKHQAVADILFDTDKYSIHYRDSTNLEYDGNNIHRNYNRWIVNLSIDIQRTLPL